MCSRTFGPAIAPSLFTCPTTKTVIPVDFASCISSIVHSFTCDTLPGEDVLSAW